VEIEDTEKATPRKKRLGLKTNKQARDSLSKIMRLYYNGGIEDTKFRNLVYAYSKLLEHDKYMFESEMSKRLDAMEQAITGTGKTTIDNKDIDNPYAADLKKRLAETEQVKSSIEQRLLETEKEMKQLKAQLSYYTSGVDE